MAKDIEKRGRPKLEVSKEVRVQFRFTQDELKAIDSYVKKHKFGSRSALVRQAIKEKITQLDAFRDA
jgi:metal-responsive CopG/Arc/MetJ family transcriptional regulator